MTTLCHSKYDPTRRVMLMLPFGTLWCEARPDDLVEIDPTKEAIVTLTGDVELDFVTRSGELLMELPLDSAYYLHAAIYAKNDRIRAIVHTHSPAVSVLTAMANFRLKAVHQNSCRFIDNMAYDVTYDGIATSQSDEAERVAGLIGESEVILQAHHGAIIATTSLAVAFDHAYYIEQAAKVQIEWEKLPSEKQSLIDEDVARATFNQLERNKHDFAQVHLNAFLKKYALDFSA